MFGWQLIRNQIIAQRKRLVSVTRLSPKPVWVNQLSLRMFERMAQSGILRARKIQCHHNEATQTCLHKTFALVEKNLWQYRIKRCV